MTQIGKGAADHRRMRFWGMFCAGMVLSLIFVWPLIGVYRSRGWPEVVFDADGPYVTVEKHLIGLSPSKVQDFGIYSENTDPDMRRARECYSEMNEFLKSKKNDVDPNWGMIRDFYGDLINRPAGRGAGEADDIEMKSLDAMPRFLLGALDGCINGSLASKLCRIYIDERLGNALLKVKSKLISAYAENSREIRDTICV